MSQTTTKDATIHSTAIDVDRCGLAVCRIYSTKCRTAIDVTFHEAGTRVGDAGSLTGLSADVHHNVTANYCCLTTTTTIDVVAHGTIHHVYLGVTVNVGSITTTIDVRNLVAAAFVLNGYLCIFIHSRLITATIYSSFYQAVVLDCQVGFLHLSESSQVGTGYNVILVIFRYEACSTIRRKVINMLPFIVGSTRELTGLKHTGIRVVGWLYA